MEAPLKIIFTLFIGLIVFAVITNMATNVTREQREELEKLKLNEMGSQIREVSSLESSQVAELADKCIKEGKADSTVTMCYAIKSDSNLPTKSEIKASWNNENYVGYLEIKDCGGSETGLFIRFATPETAIIKCK